eukprot:GCRY01001783.1.p1 GENE.GCRY01001783.1~~GCRY01001783.1.p1  ORF type:complete len:307 (-),score=28.97 GCRY01001783.1:32-952(-)
MLFKLGAFVFFLVFAQSSAFSKFPNGTVFEVNLSVDVLQAQSILNADFSKTVAQLSGDYESCEEVFSAGLSEGYYVFSNGIDAELSYCKDGYERIMQWSAAKHGCGTVGVPVILANGVVVCSHPTSTQIYSPKSNGVILKRAYSTLRGRGTTYAYHSVDSFHNSYSTVNNLYLDGLSFTISVNGVRQHLWSYSMSVIPRVYYNTCPCNGGNSAPPFVGENYYCDVGTFPDTEFIQLYVPDHVFFEGSLCADALKAECCGRDGSRPWFETRLPAYTVGADFLEFRSMSNSPGEDENVYFIEAELWGK